MPHSLTEQDLANAVGWSLAQVRAYVAAGVMDGFVESTPQGLRFDLRLPEFLAWYIERADEVLAGQLDTHQLSKMCDRRRTSLRRQPLAVTA